MTSNSMKLLLIDHRIKDIEVIINAVNSDTYCLVFNYFYDTHETILSKLRFLSKNNRYILDHFHYEPPVPPTQIDISSGLHCTPCSNYNMDDLELLPSIIEAEYLTHSMMGGNSNESAWPFYHESSAIKIQKPVFFQRAKIGETIETIPYGSTEIQTVVSKYKERAFVQVSLLDEIYKLAKTAGEVDVSGSGVGAGAVAVATSFDCIGILQHTAPEILGFKLVEHSPGGNAIITDVQTADANLSSWSSFSSFIETLKTVFHMTTLDLMACALYSNPNWKYIIDNLAIQKNITIRASNDNTGASEDGGNWVLETNNVNLTSVYFTDEIYKWQYLLATYIDNRFYGLRWNDSMYSTRGYDARLKIAAGTSNFTIETWYYETSQKGNCTIVDMGNYNYTFQIRSDGKIGLALYNLNYGWFHAESAVVPVAQWCHLAVTRSGSIFTFYINGVAKQTFNTSVSMY